MPACRMPIPAAIMLDPTPAPICQMPDPAQKTAMLAHTITRKATNVPRMLSSIGAHLRTGCLLSITLMACALLSIRFLTLPESATSPTGNQLTSLKDAAATSGSSVQKRVLASSSSASSLAVGSVSSLALPSSLSVCVSGSFSRRSPSSFPLSQSICSPIASSSSRCTPFSVTFSTAVSALASSLSSLGNSSVPSLPSVLSTNRSFS
mmetsp:Transcript_53525/g.134733  ORF Transcript_53525/g.134733 Transcript_53525/m.134733 type:complete len:207 (-) Transcript_53525:437-1057(-)